MASNSSPSSKRYAMEGGAQRNKKRNIERDARLKAKAKTRKTLREARRLIAMPPRNPVPVVG